MRLTDYLSHPEALDKRTLFQLREAVARHPYDAVARLLFLKNLFLLHDPSFGDELRRAALFVPDRSVLYSMVEDKNRLLQPISSPVSAKNSQKGRTQTLIDDFINNTGAPTVPIRRTPTPADATTDYTAILNEMDDISPEPVPAAQESDKNERSKRHETLVNTFIEKNDKITLKEEPEYTPELAEEDENGEIGEDFFTETLARIYIRQGRYEKAAEIIRRLNLVNPRKNVYFADQIRFLEKLIVNNKHKNK